MTGGEDNSHLRRSVLILVHIFRGTQREVRGSYWLKDEPWITKNDWSETGMMRAWVRRRCKLKKMFFEPAMNLRLWQTMEEWGWSAVNLAFFYPNIFGFCLNQTEEFFLAVAARLPVGAPGRMGGRIPIHASWFANNPIWKSLRWLQGTFLKKQIMWRHFRYCHIGCSKLHLFFLTLWGLTWSSAWCGSTHRGGRNIWTHSCRTTTDHSLVRSRCIGYFRIL